MNLIHIAGHLGADPETRFTQSGKKVTTLRVATRTRKAGNDDTIWWRVTIWGEQFDKMVSHLKKGSAIMVWGEVHKPEIFNDREGKPQVALEITAVHVQFSPFGKPGGGQAQAGQEGHAPAAHAHPAPPFGVFQEGAAVNPYFGGNKMGAAQPAAPGETFDDEVPF